MQRDTAAQLSDLMLRIGKQLNDSLLLVRSSESEYEFERYGETLSKILMLMLLEVMNPIYAEYPDLQPPQLR